MEESVSKDEVDDIINVKVEMIKEEETLDDDPLSIKEEPAQNDNTHNTININEEELYDYLDNEINHGDN